MTTEMDRAFRKAAAQLAIIERLADVPAEVLDLLDGAGDFTEIFKALPGGGPKPPSLPGEEAAGGPAPAPTVYAHVGDDVEAQHPFEKWRRRGKVIGSGRDGVLVHDDCPSCPHRIRHEHVLQKHAPIRTHEVAAAAEALHQEGVPVDPAQRFAAPGFDSGHTRPSVEHRRALDVLVQAGLAIDPTRASRDGTQQDVERLIHTYVRHHPEGHTPEGAPPADLKQPGGLVFLRRKQGAATP